MAVRGSEKDLIQNHTTIQTVQSTTPMKCPQAQTDREYTATTMVDNQRWPVQSSLTLDLNRMVGLIWVALPIPMLDQNTPVIRIRMPGPNTFILQMRIRDLSECIDQNCTHDQTGTSW